MIGIPSAAGCVQTDADEEAIERCIETISRYRRRRAEALSDMARADLEHWLERDLASFPARIVEAAEEAMGEALFADLDDFNSGTRN